MASSRRICLNLAGLSLFLLPVAGLPVEAAAAGGPHRTRAASVRRLGNPLRSMVASLRSERSKETIADSRIAGAYAGKRLGILAATSVASIALPVGLSLAAPPLAPLMASPVGSLGSIVVASLEEQHLGIGRRVGGAVGACVGTAVGVGKCLVRSVRRRKAGEDGAVKLARQPPTGAGPHEPLLQRWLHRAERKRTGRPVRVTHGRQAGETAGVFVGSLAGALAVPCLLAKFSPSPLLALAGILAAPVVGMVAGGIEENTIGVGRAGGEALGALLQKAKAATGRRLRAVAERLPKRSRAERGKTVAKNPGVAVVGKVLGKAKRGFLALNNAIARPIFSSLLELTSVTNGLLYSETPVQTMEFASRKAPSVDRQRLLDNFVKLAGIPGASKHEAAVGKELRAQLDALKIRYTQDKMGNIIATVPGTVKDAPTLVLTAHQDTVEATSAKSIRVKDGRVRTDERHILGADDRAGLAVILEGVKTVLDNGLAHPEMKLVFTVQEETGLVGARKIRARDVTRRPAVGVAFDATELDRIYLKSDATIMAPTTSAKYNVSQESPIVQVAMHAMARAGVRPRPIHAPVLTGAASDANTPAFNNRRLTTIALGMGHRDIHTPLEHVPVESLGKAAQTAVGIILGTCDLKVDDRQRVVPRRAVSTASRPRRQI